MVLLHNLGLLFSIQKKPFRKMIYVLLIFATLFSQLTLTALLETNKCILETLLILSRIVISAV